MKHLNEITIQFFLDGELSDVQMEQATEHLALCEMCTNALIEAESEIAQINLAFAAEKTSLVPTQRIWARIENEIDNFAVQKNGHSIETKSFWQQLSTFFTASQIAFAGSLAGIVMISMFALSVFIQQQNTTQNENNVAFDSRSIQTPETLNPRSIPEMPTSESETRAQNIAEAVSQNRQASSDNSKVIKADYKSTSLKKREKNNEDKVKPKTENRKPKTADAPLLEEKNYLTSIAQLSKTVSGSEALILRPSSRVEYESNLAMIDKVINETQKQARRNPNDENAKRALFTSYQNKIDLLSTVAEKSQLMASLR